MKIESFNAETEYDRIDSFVAINCNVSRTMAVKLIEEGKVLKNGKTVKKKEKVNIGEQITVKINDPVPLKVEAQNIPLDIVYEDTDLLVVNKPKGMVVHPAPGNYNNTMVNALLYHCKDSLSGINGILRPGIVHRIDKNTSGLLMVAKNDNSHKFLAEQIKNHSFKREYEAVVHGVLRSESGKIDAPIGRHPVKRKQMAVTQKNSKNAVTYYSVIERFNNFTHLNLKLETGRTHQIRVHMSYIGHAVAGDDVYGPKKSACNFEGQCLHAKKLGFVHPSTNEYMEFDSNLPDYFVEFLNSIK